MSTKLFFGLCLFVCLLACNADKTGESYIETIEIYKTVGDKSTAQKGALTYKEVTTYLSKDRPEKRDFYNKQGILDATEVYEYTTELLPMKSNYYDSQGNLLSQYVFTNEGDKRTRSVGIDASNNEILRIEEFDYNEKGYRVSKTVKDPSSAVQRKYMFGFDNFGNETALTVLDGMGKPLFIETYSITQKAADNTWTECWGFRNDEPSLVKYRTISYK
jgi:hypothetical protein